MALSQALRYPIAQAKYQVIISKLVTEGSPTQNFIFSSLGAQVTLVLYLMWERASLALHSFTMRTSSVLCPDYLGSKNFHVTEQLFGKGRAFY